MNIGNLVANLSVDARGMQKGIALGKSSLMDFAKSAVAIAAPLAGAFGVAKMVSGAREQMAAERKLQGVIKATGGAAGLTSQQIADYAGELQKSTNFADDVTISGAAVLATFKSIKGQTFKEALASAQDLSTVLGTDLQGSVLQIGKALENPTKGINALARAGVTFTDEEAKKIKALQKSGDLVGAQAIVLAALKGQVGGLASAMADPLTQTSNIIGDLADNAGFALLPSLKVVASTLGEWLGPATDARAQFEAIGAEIADVVRFTMELGKAIGGPVFDAFAQARQMIRGMTVEGSVGWADLGNVANLAAHNMTLGIMELLPQSESAFETVGIYGAALWEGLIAGAWGLVDDIQDAFTVMKDFAVIIGKTIAAAFEAAWNFEDPIAAAKNTFTEGLANIGGDALDKNTFIDDFKQKWDETVANATEGIQDAGGMKNLITVNRDKLATDVKSALDSLPPIPGFNKGPDVEVPGSGGTGKEGGGGRAGDLKDAKNEGLAHNSKEFFSSIVSAMRSGSRSTEDRTAEATERAASAAERQLRVSEDMLDALEEDDGIDLE